MSVPEFGTDEYRWWAKGAAAENIALTPRNPKVREAVDLLRSLDEGPWTDPLDTFRKIYFPTRRERRRDGLLRRKWRRLLRKIGRPA